jgi:hypothetical protein
MRSKLIGLCLLMVLATILYLSASPAQYPIMEAIAEKVIHKYEQSSCEQLFKEKEKGQPGQPKSPKEQEAIQILKNDPKMRTAFLNKVAPPIANKMFECGMIP